MSRLHSFTAANSTAPSITSTPTPGTIVFGIFATVASITTIWQGHRAWKMSHQANVQAGSEVEIGRLLEAHVLSFKSLPSDMLPVNVNLDVGSALPQETRPAPGSPAQALGRDEIHIPENIANASRISVSSEPTTHGHSPPDRNLEIAQLPEDHHMRTRGHGDTYIRDQGTQQTPPSNQEC